MDKSNTIAIGEFKAKALRILDTVAKSGQAVVITRRGRPLVEVIPYREGALESVPGKLAGTILEEHDIVSPLGPDLWHAAR